MLTPDFETGTNLDSTKWVMSDSAKELSSIHNGTVINVPNKMWSSRTVFSEPIYGIIGGLHYPVPDGRLFKFGLDVQPIVSTESLFKGVSEEDVEADIERIKALNPKIVSLSAHDSSDEALEKFRTAFGETYRELLVGDLIIIGE